MEIAHRVLWIITVSVLAAIGLTWGWQALLVALVIDALAHMEGRMSEHLRRRI